MKTVLIQGAVAAGALCVSAIVFYLAQEATQDVALDRSTGFTPDDVRIAVEQALDEHERELETGRPSRSARVLADIQAKIDEVRHGQDGLVDRLETLANAKPRVTEEWEIPDRERLESIVAAAITSHREREAEERRQRDQRRREERAQRDRERTVAKMQTELGLSATQSGTLAQLLERLDIERSRFSQKIDVARRSGDAAPASVGELHAGMQQVTKDYEESLRELLTAEQLARYEELRRKAVSSRRPQQVERQRGGGRDSR